MSLSIRPLTTNDLDEADDIVIAAYRLNSSRLPELRRYLAIQPDGWRLALLDGRMVGLGGIVNYRRKGQMKLFHLPLF